MNEYKVKLSADNYLVQDHRIDGIGVLPPAAYLDILARCLKWQRFSLSQVTYPQMASLKDGQSIFLIIQYNEQTQQILIYQEENHLIYFQAIVETHPILESDMPPFDTGACHWIFMHELYQWMSASLIEHGEFMQVLGRTQLNAQKICMMIRLSPKARPFLSYFYLHPALLMGATYAIVALHFEKIGLDKNVSYLAFSIDRVDVYGRITTEEVLVFAELLPCQDERVIRCRIHIFSSAGHLLIVINGLTYKGFIRTLTEDAFEKTSYDLNQYSFDVQSQHPFYAKLPFETFSLPTGQKRGTSYEVVSKCFAQGGWDTKGELYPETAWIKKEPNAIDVSPYTHLLVFLNKEQLWMRNMFGELKVKRPIYYVLVDDPRQFEQGLGSLSSDSRPLIYYLGGMHSKNLSRERLISSQTEAFNAFIILIRQLQAFPNLALYLCKHNAFECAANLYDFANLLKKVYTHWVIECIETNGNIDKLIRKDSAMLVLTPKKTEKELQNLLMFNEGLKELEFFCYHLIKYKLTNNGLLWKSPQSDFIESLSDYKDYFSAFMNQLILFEKKQDRQVNNKIETWDNLMQLRLNISKKYPSLLPYLNILAVLAEKLVTILQNKVSLQEVLFPYGQDKLVRAFYQDNALMNYYNDIIAQSLEQIGTNRTKAMDVLELGAGFGTTAAAILKQCKQGIDYRFTDIDPQLVLEAQRQFRHYPHFQAFGLDINKLNLHQTMDIIIATDILSKADNIFECLKSITKLLKPQGLLVILESTTNNLFLSATFGLMKMGPFLNENQRIRGSRLMTESSWQWMLEALGFHVKVHPLTEETPLSLIFATLEGK